MSWDGKVLITTGAHTGKQWKDLHRNSLDYYTDWRNEKKIPETWRNFAKLEIARRDKAGIY